MRLSTSTNILFYSCSDSTTVDAFECLILCKEAGYEAIDVNAFDLSEPGCPLTQDNWEAWTLDFKAHADQLGLMITQSHNPIYNVCEPDLVLDWDWQEELTRRSMIAAGILGVDWVVAHAGTALPNGVYNKRETLNKNADYFGKMSDFARSLGLKGIAIENMAYFGPWSSTLPPQLCATTDGLIELVDYIDTDNVGVCWDFGHANLCNESQVESLLRIGNRLKALHVNDNMGTADDHTLPFIGTINWAEIMPILARIHYEGDLTYEIHKYLRRVPQALYPQFLKQSVDVGKHLISLVK